MTLTQKNHEAIRTSEKEKDNDEADAELNNVKRENIKHGKDSTKREPEKEHDAEKMNSGQREKSSMKKTEEKYPQQKRQ